MLDSAKRSEDRDPTGDTNNDDTGDQKDESDKDVRSDPESSGDYDDDESSYGDDDSSSSDDDEEPRNYRREVRKLVPSLLDQSKSLLYTAKKKNIQPKQCVT